MGLLTRILLAFISFLELMLILRCLVSWLLDARSTKIGQIIYRITDPMVQPFQRLLCRSEFFRTLPIDVSPLFVFMILQILQELIY